MLLHIEAKTFVDLLLDISDVALPSKAGISTARKASPIKNLRSVAKLKAAERLSRLVSLKLL